MKLFIDIETNPLEDWLNLSDLTTLHCVAVSKDGEPPFLVEPKELKALLKKTDELIGHNIQSFDVPALEKLLKIKITCKVTDTLLLARLKWPDLRNDDFHVFTTPETKPYIGSHGLKAYGYRFGMHKGDAPDFTTFTPEMGEYCLQDVRVTLMLWQKLGVTFLSQTSRDLEHNFAAIIRLQERIGFPLNVEAAQSLHATLLKQKLEIETQMRVVFPDKHIERVSVKTGKPIKAQIEEFNPGSRLQIASRLTEKYGWVPSELTPDGRPRVDESVLASLDYPEAKFLATYLLCTKRLGMLADGDGAWLKLQRNGRLHGRVNTNGAVTGRCTHSGPNMAQVPTDPAYRALFVPDKGSVLVGVDASGLELRCLAHFLGKYDGGAYARKVIASDIHWENAKSFSLVGNTTQDKANPAHKSSRNQAKGGIYALIYGAADAKLGLVLGGNAKLGKRSRSSFMASVPAFASLKNDIEVIVAAKNRLVGIDGRVLPIRSGHAALNTLLQSAGAVVMKMAAVLAHKHFKDNKLEVKQVASVHDEYQFMCHHSIAQRVGGLGTQAIREAGEFFKFRCPLDGEFRVGANWAETH
jgi:DNA polymerase I-like protein with 3'-5' exonuclease and polymerase domains